MVSISSSELPDDDIETIDADIDDTEIIPIAEILFLREDGPWYTKAELENKLLVDYNIDTSRPTITDRLEDLMAMGLVDIKEAGDTHIFYYKFDGSEWPIPPDATFESEYSDFIQVFDKTYTWWAVVGFLGVIVGGVLTLIGSVTAYGALVLPISADSVIAVALLTLAGSYALIFLFLIAVLFDVVIDTDVPEFIR